jgi:hypothetical protein
VSRRALGLLLCVVVVLFVSMLMWDGGMMNVRLEGTVTIGVDIWTYQFRAVVMPVEMTPPAPLGGLAAPEW